MTVDEYVDKVVAAAPPIPAEARDQIAELLRPHAPAPAAARNQAAA